MVEVRTAVVVDRVASLVAEMAVAEEVVMEVVGTAEVAGTAWASWVTVVAVAEETVEGARVAAVASVRVVVATA